MELMNNIFKRCTVKTRLPRQHFQSNWSNAKKITTTRLSKTQEKGKSEMPIS